jgi:hypothetical protein
VAFIKDILRARRGEGSVIELPTAGWLEEEDETEMFNLGLIDGTRAVGGRSGPDSELWKINQLQVFEWNLTTQYWWKSFCMHASRAGTDELPPPFESLLKSSFKLIVDKVAQSRMYR